MGLDMYLYKVSKSTVPPTVLKGRTFDDVMRSFPTLNLFQPGADASDLTKELKPYFQYTELLMDVIDVPQLRIDNNIPEDAYISGRSMSSDKASFWFTWATVDSNSESKSVTVDYNDPKYIKTITDKFPYCDIKQIMYWRRADDICDMIHDDHPRHIDNCEYVRLSPKLVNKIISETYTKYGHGGTDCFDNDYAMLSNIKNMTHIFYKEWY